MTGPTAPDWNFDPARSTSWTAVGSHRWRTRDGAGLGASHQTRWTGPVGKLIEMFGRLDGQALLDAGKTGAFAKEQVEEEEVVAG
jgi:hypothetical protein